MVVLSRSPSTHALALPLPPALRPVSSFQGPLTSMHFVNTLPAVPVYIGTPSVGTTTPTSEAIVTTISGSTTTVPISYVASVGSTTASTSVTTPTTFGNNSSVEVTTSLPSYFATVPVTTTKTSKTATHSQPITTTTASSAAQPEAELLTGRFRGGVPPYLVFFVALLCQCTLITWVIETITIGT